MKYHVIKRSRKYSGKPYCGATSDNHPAEADIMADAFTMALHLNEKNPIGWDVYDSETATKLTKKCLNKWKGEYGR